MPIRKSDDFTVYPLSEYAVTVVFDQEIQRDTWQKINRFNALLHNNLFDGFRTTVPAYTTLSVFFDPVQVIRSSRLSGINGFERVSNYLKGLTDISTEIIIPQTETIIVPLCYGGDFGPDLEEVARLHGMTAEDVVEMHSTATYHVHLIGFAPGFAYLGGMPEALTTPRKPTPRNAVPAGSVGIAGKQTGIYSLETPGGWQIIGRTPLRLFDLNREKPIRLKTGDRVVFKSMEHDRFESYNDSPDADTFH